MKSILFLLLSTAFSLLPFVAFSSTSTSDNPIITLPTSTNDNPLVDDQDAPLQFGTRYRIVSSFRGAAGGDVILGTTPTTDTCPNGVFRQSSDVGPDGTPVEFIAANSTTSSDEISETDDIIIRFAIATTRLCVSYTYWKVGDYDVSLGARLLETGGSSFFRIVKAPELSDSYILLNCPGPFECPSCPADQCQVVGEVSQNGRRRLALGGNGAILVAFRKL